MLQGENNDNDDSDDNEEEEKEEGEDEQEGLNETEQESKKMESIKTNKRLDEHDLEGGQKITRKSSVDAFETTETNLSKLRNKILEEQYHNKLTTKCYQLKLHNTIDDDFEKVIRNSHENEIEQLVVDRIKLIEDQWRELDLWEILQSVNPLRVIKFDRDELFKQDSTPLENNDVVIFRRSIVFCGMFEYLMRIMGWKVGDTLDIEEDICDVVGQLLMKVEKQDRSSLLDCMQSAMVNIQVEDSKQDGDKLRTLLLTKKKYNGLNLACILLEQMIHDNKDNNVSWMQIVCAQFIDLVVQLIIDPDYREDVHWTLNYFLKLESEWKIADVYNLAKNGMLMFHGKQKKFLGFSVFPGKQKEFRRYLMILRNLALYPSLNISSTKKKKTVDLYSRDKNIWRCLDEVATEEEIGKSVDQVLGELKEDEIGQTDKHTIQIIITNSQTILKKYKDVREYPDIFERELDRIRKSEQKYGVDAVSSCLAVTSMALQICKKFRPSNTQLVSYCLLVVQRRNKKGRLLEILTGEGKSCIIAMVAATYALLGRTVDIVTSSPVLSQRDADEWREFYTYMKLDVGCNVENNTKEDVTCYKCPIVYGTVETFARDILKTEFLLNDVRYGQKFDIVIVDEVDSMLIDQGVQCTYLSHDVASIGMRHLEPILVIIWMHVSRLLDPVVSEEGVRFYLTEPEFFLDALSRLSTELDPLQILRLAEEDEELRDIKKGFSDEYLSKDIEGRKEMLRSIESFAFFRFAQKVLHLDIDVYHNIHHEHDFISECHKRNDQSRISILLIGSGLVSILLHGDMIKNRLAELIAACVSSTLPVYLRGYCESRSRCWIDHAFLAKEMQQGREYIVQGDAIYPVDYESTGVTETNKKWGDGLQQFLEMKHGLPQSPLSLITNFLSNIDFFDRYKSNIVGVSGTLGNQAEKNFMCDTFSVEFATIPTSKRRKLFELEGVILDDESEWLKVVSKIVESAVANKRAVLVICEDIATADKIHKSLCSRVAKRTLYLHTKSEEGRMNKVLKPTDVFITTNLGARGTDFRTDDVVNKNGGLFVLVTFIPLNDRVEKQAFGRTGRRGATGSCQIIVNRKAMPEWARQCETIEKVKRLRDSIEMRRLNNATEVNTMRKKQELFQEYCEIKKKFVSSSESDPDDLNIQKEILDAAWAWIQESNYAEMVQELRRIIGDCSERAKQFESDNLYHILKFGAVRLLKGDFGEATKFYDRVIRMDPEWSAFAHYNRAYCTIQVKGDGYIQRAINDLNAAFCNLEKYKTNCLFYEIIERTNWGDATRLVKWRSTQYYIMIECQFLHHIDSQIIETIRKLEAINTVKGEVTTVRRDILDLIAGADCRIEQMLQEYRQLGLLFTYNIDVEPQFCYKSQIVSSLVMLESVADIILMAFFNGILVNSRSMELKDTIDAACTSMEATGDESLEWMSRCVSRAIITGINSVDFIRDVSSLVLIEHNERKSNYKIETPQFTQFENSQAEYISEMLYSTNQVMNKIVSCQEDEICMHMTNVAMGALREKIEQKIRERIIQGGNLPQKLWCLYGGVKSPIRSDLEQFFDFIRGMAQSSFYSSQLSNADLQTSMLQNIAVDLRSKSQNSGITATSLVESYTTEITTAVTEIEIGTVITKFYDLLCDMLNLHIHKSTTTYGYVDPIFEEAINRALTFAWSDIIREMLQIRITRSMMFDVQDRMNWLFAHERRKFFKSMNRVRSHSILNCIDSQNNKQHKPLPDLSSNLKKYNSRMKKSHGPYVSSKTDARLISNHVERNIIVLDDVKQTILTISSHDTRDSVELLYNPPCAAYPRGHFDANVKEKVIKARRENNDDDDDLLYSAIDVAMDNKYSWRSQQSIEEYIDNHPSDAAMLLTSDGYACQLKRGCALLRLDMNQPTRQVNQCEHVELDLFSGIEQALKSEKVSQLAEVLAEYESESRSAAVNSSERGTKMMTSPVSPDARRVFLFSGSSFEAKVYRQLVVGKINENDITLALQICFVGHQMPFYRDNIQTNLIPIYDVPFDRMLRIESHEQEKSKFLSICDEWYTVLEPHELMNIEQRYLLMEWISTRQYANTKDPIVSIVIEKCSEARKKEEERKLQEAKKIREEKRKEEERKLQEAKKMKEEKEKLRKLQKKRTK